MLHYNVISHSTYDCKEREYRYQMVDKLLPLIPDAKSLFGVTAPFSLKRTGQCTMKFIEYGDGYAIYELREDKYRIVINLSVVVWDAAKQKLAWEKVDSWFFRLVGTSVGNYGDFRRCIPASLPWVTTIGGCYDDIQYEDIDILNDFARSMAYVSIVDSQQQR